MKAFLVRKSVSINVGVAYGTDVEKVLNILLKIASQK